MIAHSRWITLVGTIAMALLAHGCDDSRRLEPATAPNAATSPWRPAGNVLPSRQLNVLVQATALSREVQSGEPILIRVTITNNLPHPIEYHGYGRKATSWNAETVGISLVNIYREGETLNQFLLRPPVKVPKGVSGTSREVVPAGQSIVIETDVRKWTLRDGWRPGTYNIDVRVDNLHIDDHASAQISSDPFSVVIR